MLIIRNENKNWLNLIKDKHDMSTKYGEKKIENKYQL